MNKAIDMQRLARLGAIARLRELEEEAAAIRKAFPGLSKAEPVAPAEPPAPATRRKKRKRTMTPEARKAAAERMRAYWAKKRNQ